MTAPAEIFSPDLHFARRSLWSVRLAALLSMVFVGSVVFPMIHLEHPLTLLWWLSFQIPYLIILWRLRQKSQKKGFALAIGFGAVAFVSAFLLLLSLFSDLYAHDWRQVVSWGALTLMQAAMVVGATKSFRALASTSDDKRLLRRGFLVGAIMLFIILLITSVVPIHLAIPS